MRSHRLVAVAGAAVLTACLTTSTQAAAAATDCTDHTFVQSGQVVEGRTALPWSYFISPRAGTIQVCLDGPDDADFDLVLQRMAYGGPETVATASGEGADKTLSFNGVPSAYRVEVVATSGSGAYTVGATIP